ncbi:hypothetical protein BY996DRAFT_3184649 [Phakopsora pachyrhizi]|nr:hypothetical protein BY996DRAFT_3184649 [Phakopsora pachyrhizi]
MRSVRSLIQSEYSDSSVPNLIDKILSGVHLVRITSSAELGFFFKNLPRWLERNNKVKLIVLDSITAHTRYVSMSINDRSIIASIVRDGLMIASSRYSCAIVVTTQLTTKLSGRGAILITPDFQSNAWSTTKMWRTVLAYNQDGSRRAVVAVNDRSNQLFKFEPITFEIDSIGIYDPESLIQNTQNTN